MTAFLPWWLGALVLAAVTVAACLVARQPLGVSGILGRLVSLREELRAERSEKALAEVDQAALEAALAAATALEFGGDPTALGTPGAAAPEPEAEADAAPEPPAREAAEPASACAAAQAPARPTLAAHATFLCAVVAGALLVTLLRGAFRPSLTLPAAYAALLAPGLRGLAALLGGGVLVGVGTALSGGCTTGHGLTGSSRLQPGSLAATATFFGTAVAVSFLLEVVR